MLRGFENNDSRANYLIDLYEIDNGEKAMTRKERGQIKKRKEKIKILMIGVSIISILIGKTTYDIASLKIDKVKESQKIDADVLVKKMLEKNKEKEIKQWN